MSLHLIPCTIRDAKSYISIIHRTHAAPAGGRFAVAVMDGTLKVGVAIAGVPVSRILASDKFTLEITRVATNGTYNACSILYGACRRASKALGYRKLITYTKISEPGTSLRASGFIAVGQTKSESWDRPGRHRKTSNTEPKIRWEVIL